MISDSRPNGWLSTRIRRSSFTTSRSFATGVLVDPERRHAVGFEPQRQRQVLGRHRLPEHRHVVLRVGVALTADRRDHRGVPFGIDVLRSLEHQMLEQVREAGAARSFRSSNRRDTRAAAWTIGVEWSSWPSPASTRWGASSSGTRASAGEWRRRPQTWRRRAPAAINATDAQDAGRCDSGHGVDYPLSAHQPKPGDRPIAAPENRADRRRAALEAGKQLQRAAAAVEAHAGLDTPPDLRTPVADVPSTPNTSPCPCAKPSTREVMARRMMRSSVGGPGVVDVDMSGDQAGAAIGVETVTPATSKRRNARAPPTFQAIGKALARSLRCRET